MANTTVGIRERIRNADGRWRWGPSIPVPQLPLKPEDTNRQGVFYIFWTANRKKREKAITGKSFEWAVKAARVKERHLQDAADGVQRPDPLKRAERKTIAQAIEHQLEKIEVSKDPKTLKAHRQALRQFERWTDKTFIDQVDHDHLMAFRSWLLKNGNEKKNAKKRGNDRLTANWKAMRVNKLVKETLGLLPSKGPIKKSDLGKMKPNTPPKDLHQVAT
jgi:hypothetical protein